MNQTPQKRSDIGGQAQKESIVVWIIILMAPAPIIDPFPAWKPILFLCHIDTAKGKKYEIPLVGSLSCVFVK